MARQRRTRAVRRVGSPPGPPSAAADLPNAALRATPAGRDGVPAGRLAAELARAMERTAVRRTPPGLPQADAEVLDLVRQSCREFLAVVEVVADLIRGPLGPVE